MVREPTFASFARKGQRVVFISIRGTQITGKHNLEINTRERQDTTRLGKTRQDKTRQERTRHDKTRKDKTRLDKTRQD